MTDELKGDENLEDTELPPMKVEVTNQPKSEPKKENNSSQYAKDYNPQDIYQEYIEERKNA